MSKGYTTGYVIPAEALRRYLVEGAGLTWLVKSSYTSQSPPEGQPSMEWVAEFEFFHNCLNAFSDIRDAALPGIRTKLELICSFTVEDQTSNEPKNIYYVQTGAFKSYQSWARTSPNELDVIGITTFIEAANAMLPDDDARLRAGFKLEELEFEVLSKSCIRPPFYREDERKEVQALPMLKISKRRVFATAAIQRPFEPTVTLPHVISRGPIHCITRMNHNGSEDDLVWAPGEIYRRSTRRHVPLQHSDAWSVWTTTSVPRGRRSESPRATLRALLLPPPPLRIHPRLVLSVFIHINVDVGMDILRPPAHLAVEPLSAFNISLSVLAKLVAEARERETLRCFRLMMKCFIGRTLIR